MKKQRRRELFWHDPWGIRESLLYSFGNACAAMSAFDPNHARLLKSELRKFLRNERATLKAAVGILDTVMRDCEKQLPTIGNLVIECSFEKLNLGTGPADGNDVTTSCIELSSGSRIPQLGFGTALFAEDCSCSNGQCCRACIKARGSVHSAVLAAAKHGYRHFDCAQCYNNEEVIGEALTASGVPREHFFLASKISSSEDYGASATAFLVGQQLKKLQTTYLDLYYLHDDIGDINKEKAAWRALECLHEHGIIKHLGLSNYRTGSLKRVMSYARVYPSVVQVKYDVFHPGYQWEEEGIDNVVAFAQSRGIAVVGYGNFSGWPSLLRAQDDPHIHSIADHYQRTPQQILLRHGLQKGMVLIPASRNEANLQSNTHIFDFSLRQSDEAYLDSLATFVAFKSIPWLPQNGFVSQP